MKSIFIAILFFGLAATAQAQRDTPKVTAPPEAFFERFAKFLATSTGSSTRITRAALLDTPLSIDRGEVTDKGSINQRAVLEHRAALVEQLYAPTPPAYVMTL